MLILLEYLLSKKFVQDILLIFGYMLKVLFFEFIMIVVSFVIACTIGFIIYCMGGEIGRSYSTWADTASGISMLFVFLDCMVYFNYKSIKGDWKI